MPTAVITLTASTGGDRLDRWLAGALPDRSRAEVQRWIKEGRVTVDGAVVKPSHKLAAGAEIMIALPEPAPPTVAAEAIPLAIVYEDDNLLVIDKPAGMVVHPAPGGAHRSGTLVNAVLAHAPGLAVGGAERPGIVHRLDKDTSGLILVAKNDLAQRALQAQFKARTVEKVYLALVEGDPPTARGRIEAAIGRDPHYRQRMAVVADDKGRAAITEFTVRERFPGYALLEVHPLTGRTHQIRVHLAFIGLPIAGDVVYGHRRKQLHCPRHFLHAHRLRFRLPGSETWVEFSSPLPPDLQEVLERLRSRPGPRASSATPPRY